MNNQPPLANEPPVMIGMMLNEGEQWKIMTTVPAEVGQQVMAEYEQRGTFIVSNGERSQTTYAPVALAVWDIVHMHAFTGMDTTIAAVVPSEVDSAIAIPESELSHDPDDDRRL